MSKELKRIDLNAGHFEANGKKYFIEGAMSIERYAEFQLYEKELAYGLTVKGIFERLQKVYQLLNKMQFADSAVIIYDVIKGLAKLEDREPTVLKICALIINEENEDRKEFNEDLINRKIADWKAEGIDMQDFFYVASVSVNGLRELYKKIGRVMMGAESL